MTCDLFSLSLQNHVLNLFRDCFGTQDKRLPSKYCGYCIFKKGITVYEAKAEHLPFQDNSFDFALMVTTLCFLENPLKALQEIRRILKPAGKVIIGMLDEDSPLGKLYEEKRNQSKFYEDARFYPVNQVLDWLKKLKFDNLQTVQTIFKNPGKIQSLEPIEEGFGKGLFVVISALDSKSILCKSG